MLLDCPHGSYLYAPTLAVTGLLISNITTVQIITMKVKVKFTLEQATKAHRGIRGIALLFL
jgi:hypothetical protein